MDPLTAIGLVSNILSFIDFSARLLKGAKEVHDSQHGVLEENRNREAIMREMQRMSTRMLVSEPQQKADDNSSLSVLARECRELSTQLISLLEKIKPKDPGSTTQSLASALRNKIYDSERASLEARLNDCRAQLHLELDSLTRTDTLERLERLLQASKLDELKLDRIESHIAQLRESISLAPSTSEARPMLMRLLAEEEKVFTSIAQDRILKCLSFEGMNRRSNMVFDTHSNTYEWILENDSTSDQASKEVDQDNLVHNASNQPQIIEDAEKVRARDKLRTWLESGSSRDVFHLSGKLGSGKSTLMKHIRASPRTEEKLKNWAGGRQLTIADFYFWNIGSDYEKSLRGLYTSLLYQIFSQCPGFISKVWPAQWKTANSAPWLISKTIEVSERDIIQAFSRVIDSHDVLESHCFAFFIDGLDEFQSTVQDDHRDLVKLLCQWAATPSGNIKICVSSREYPVFMDGFSPTLRIRFHELTRRDMDIYIRDKLAHANTEESFEGLVSLIMSKADGVFLWVALVVKSLREGLENGMSCSDLTQEVDILPEQLESLYKHILTSLGKSARRRAYQTFAMVTELKKYENYRMSLLAYSFFEEYEAGGRFFMKPGNDFPMDSVTGRIGKERVQSSSRRLAGYCKGLVEPYKMPIWEGGPNNKSPCVAAWEDWSMELDFAHRSISEFLESDEVQRNMRLSLRGFDHVDAVLNLMISDILYESTTSIYNTSRSGITMAVSLEIIDHYDLIEEPFTYLNRFRQLLDATKPKGSMTSNTMMLMAYSWGDGKFGFTHFAEVVGEATGTYEMTQEIAPDEDRVQKTRYHYISDPLHKLTRLGLCDYPLWLIANRSGLSEQPETISALAHLCLDGSGVSSDDVLKPLNVLEALFERGWVSPDTITKCRVTRYGGLWSERSDNLSELNLWQNFVIKMLAGRYHQTLRDKTRDRSEEVFQARTQHDGRVLQLLLKFKPDIDFSFDICLNKETEPWRRDFLLNLDGQKPVLKFTTMHVAEDDKKIYERPWEGVEVGLPSESDDPAGRHLSMREFIALSLFDNKIELLKMLDEQSKFYGDGQANTSTATASILGEKDRMRDQIQSEEDAQRDADEHSVSKLVNNVELQNYLERSTRWAGSLVRNEYVRYAVAVLTGKRLLFEKTAHRIDLRRT